MPRAKKLKPEVELMPSGRIRVRDNRKIRHDIVDVPNPYGNNRMEMRGKTTREIKTVVLPYYIAALHNERKKVKALQIKLKRIEPAANAILRAEKKKIKTVIDAEIKSLRKSHKADVAELAIARSEARLRGFIMKQVGSIDAALGFSAMIEFNARQDIASREMSLLIILVFFGELRAADFWLFGFRIVTNNIVSLNILVEKGYVEKFSEKGAIFAANSKGIKLVNKFKSFYGKKLKAHIESDEYKKRSRRWAEEGE